MLVYFRAGQGAEIGRNVLVTWNNPDVGNNPVKVAAVSAGTYNGATGEWEVAQMEGKSDL